MNKLPVHESATSDKVVAFIEIDSLPETIQALNENGSLYGLYYDQSGDIKANDIWNIVHDANPCNKEIFKKEQNFLFPETDPTLDGLRDWKNSCAVAHINYINNKKILS